MLEEKTKVYEMDMQVVNQLKALMKIVKNTERETVDLLS